MTPEHLACLFDVDLDAGRLFWRHGPRTHPRLAGQEAGGARRSHSGKQYWIVKIDGRAVKRSHLIYLAANGELPSPCCDHINGDSLDDRASNLRRATVAENAQNHKRRARRIALPMGVRHMASGRFQARIGHLGKQVHLGAYATPEEAAAIYRAKRKELFGEFA
jgi:hypothetical protein